MRSPSAARSPRGPAHGPHQPQCAAEQCLALRGAFHLAVPGKHFGLTLILVFSDRCGKSVLASSVTGSAMTLSPVRVEGLELASQCLPQRGKHKAREACDVPSSASEVEGSCPSFSATVPPLQPVKPYAVILSCAAPRRDDHRSSVCSLRGELHALISPFRISGPAFETRRWPCPAPRCQNQATARR